jgi:nucleoside-diphosphate-sugar epimerase
METKNTLLITGAAGYVGTMLVKQFASRPDVDHIVCLDKEDKPELLNDLQNITWIKSNMSDDGWQSKAGEKKPNIVIHTAWQIREMYGKKDLQWKWNVVGSDKVFAFAFSTPSVKRLVHYSTVSSYGAESTNRLDYLFKESEAFRDNEYLYALEKKVVEENLKALYDKTLKNGSIAPQIAIIRPAAITGPRGRYSRIRFGLQSALSGQLKENFTHRLVSKLVSWVPVTPKWLRQFIHEDDICDVTELLAFGKYDDKYEAYNACPPGEAVLGPDMAKAVNKKMLKVQPWMIRIVFFFAWHLSKGAIPTSRGGWRYYSYPVAVDGSKISNKLGFKYTMNSKDAFVKKEGRYMKYI